MDSEVIGIFCAFVILLVFLCIMRKKLRAMEITMGDNDSAPVADIYGHYWGTSVSNPVHQDPINHSVWNVSIQSGSVSKRTVDDDDLPPSYEEAVSQMTKYSKHGEHPPDSLELLGESSECPNYFDLKI